MDPWEQSVAGWRDDGDEPAAAGDGPDRAEVLRLARELAAQREAGQDGMLADLEQLKETLRERAAAVAARERELEELRRRLERTGSPRRLVGRRSKARQPEDADAQIARERAAAERLRELEQRERELAARSAALDAVEAELAERERSALARGEALAAGRREREQELERLAAAALRADPPLTAPPDGDPATRAAELDARARALAELETELAERERALAAREQQPADR